MRPLLGLLFEGTGVGAVRRCELTTGAFIEPITVWDEPRVLAFDVKSQPPPLQEWSPYSHVYAPHLAGFFRTTHGEFRQVQIAPDRTRLEGPTWYSLQTQPSIYWQVLADTTCMRFTGACSSRSRRRLKIQSQIASRWSSVPESWVPSPRSLIEVPERATAPRFGTG